MSTDGQRLYNYRSTQLRVSTTEWGSSTLLHTFDFQTTFVRELDDGELLVGVQGDVAGGTTAGSVWRSTGWAAGSGSPSFAKVLDLSSHGAWIDGRWGHSAHGADIFLHEYGLKVAPNNGRMAYHSADGGATWRILYEGAAADNYHGHGVAYDPFADAVWLTNGDTAAHRSIRVSTDWREDTPTWTVLAAGTWQAVGIVPMADRVLFTSDDPPNGVWKVERQGAGYGPVEVAWALNDATTLTHTPGIAYQRTPDDPIFISFPPNTGTGETSLLIKTTDGVTFEEVWTDPQGAYAGPHSQGLSMAFGPTAEGHIVGDLLDDRQPYTVLILDT